MKIIMNSRNSISNLRIIILFCLFFGFQFFSPILLLARNQEEQIIGTKYHYNDPESSLSHEYISINGNADFHAQTISEGWSGNGTKSNPYIIENYLINITYRAIPSRNGIDIQNTDVYFIIQNVVVINLYSSNKSGFYLYNVTNGLLKDNTALKSDRGFHLQSSTNNTLIGNSANTKTHGACFYLQNCVSNRLISNIGSHNSYYGFFLISSTNNSLINNTASNNYRNGFILEKSHNNLFDGNVVNDNSIGIILENSTNNSFTANTFANNRNGGIELDSSPNNIILENVFVRNGLNIRGHNKESSIQKSVENNTVNGKELIYLQNEVSSVPISSEVGQVILVNCTSIQVKDAIINDISTIGFLLVFCTKVSLINNYVNNSNWLFYNRFGFYLLNSNNNTLISNTAAHNYYDDFHLQNSNHNLLLKNKGKKSMVIINSSCNNFTANEVNQMYLWLSPQNIIKNNKFFEKGLGIRAYNVENTVQKLVENNTINGEEIIYLQSKVNFTSTFESGQVILINCSSFIIENSIVETEVLTAFNLNFCANASMNGNMAKNNYGGFVLWYCENINLAQNFANNGYNGFLLYNSFGNKLVENVASSNWGTGFDLYQSSNNTLIGNTANFNKYGILLTYSNHNIIRENNLLNNFVECIEKIHSVGNIISNNLCEPIEVQIPGFDVIFLIGFIALATVLQIKRKITINR